jgi:pimeloyl-ACP methyl ester carboxylesterase
VLLAPTGFGRVHLAEVLTLPGVREVVEAALPFALRSRMAVTLAYLTLVTSGSRPEAELVERVTSRDRSAVAAVRDATHAIASSGRGDDAFHRRRIRYDGPVRVIWGDRDRLVPAHHRHGVKAALPQADIELWKGMGHHPLRERLDELTRLIATVSRTDPRPLASALSDAA